MNRKLLFLTILTILLASLQTMSCEFKFKVSAGEKETYQVGDQIVVDVQVVYTHNICPEGIEATKFNFTGIKALGATKWSEVGEGIYLRKFKILIEEEKKNRHVFNAVRTCEKDGGSGSILFNVNK